MRPTNARHNRWLRARRPGLEVLKSSCRERGFAGDLLHRNLFRPGRRSVCSYRRQALIGLICSTSMRSERSFPPHWSLHFGKCSSTSSRNDYFAFRFAAQYAFIRADCFFRCAALIPFLPCPASFPMAMDFGGRPRRFAPWSASIARFSLSRSSIKSATISSVGIQADGITHEAPPKKKKLRDIA